MSASGQRGSKSFWLGISGVVLLIAAWWMQPWIAGGEHRERAATPLTNVTAKDEVEDRVPLTREVEGPHTVRSSETELAQRAEEDLRLRVLDAKGHVAEGVTVVVRHSPRGEVLLQGISNAAGELRFAAVRELISDAAATTLIEVVATGITPEPKAQLLDPVLCFASITDYALPPIGELVLICKRIDGSELVRGEAEVLAQVVVGGKRPRRFGGSKQSLRAEFENGSARFTSVQAEVPLFLSVQDQSWDLFAGAEHPGLEAGRTTTIELRFELDQPVFRGRVLDGATGKPVANEHLLRAWVAKKANTSSSEGTFIWTNEEGVFYAAARSLRDVVSLELDISSEDYGRQLRSVAIPFGPGLYDAGDWHLQKDGPSLAGIVLDAEGRAAAGAQVLARVRLNSGTSLDDVRFDHLVAQLDTDAEGRFVWDAPPISTDPQVVAATLIELQASDATEKSVPIHVLSGRRDIELRMERTGGFVAEVIHSHRVPFHLFTLEFRTARAGAAEDDKKWTQIFAAHANEIGAHGLLAGLYDFRLRLNQTAEHALLVPDIRVRSGELTQDPRLQPLDAREQFQLFDFEILHPPECVPHGLNLVLSRTGLAEPLHILGAMVSSTHAAALTPPGIYDATFKAPGFETRTLRQLATGCSVELKPAYSIRLLIESRRSTDVGGSDLGTRSATK